MRINPRVDEYGYMKQLEQNLKKLINDDSPMDYEKTQRVQSIANELLNFYRMQKMRQNKLNQLYQY